MLKVMTKENFLPYTKPSINQIDIHEVTKALNSDHLTRGPLVEAFESAVAHYCQVKYAVAFNSGTSALMGAYFAANLRQQDSLLTTPNSFVATAGAAVQRGTTPVFLDIDCSSGNLDLQQLEYNLARPSSRGRICVAPVHFAGIPVDMQKIDQSIQNPETVVIEDAAHALGSTYFTGEKVGSCRWSDMTIFSFHAAKTITTGEGGMVTTNSEDFYRRLKLFRNNGIEREAPYLQGEAAPWYYEVQHLSGNYNFTELQAALGLSQMARLDSFVEKRRQLMKAYRALLKEIPYLHLFAENFDAYSAYHLCVVQINFNAYKTTRTQVMNRLRERMIGTQVHYIPIYKHPYFINLCGDISDYFPKMEAYYSQALSLPFYYDLQVEEVERVVNTLKKVLQGE
ncbi:Uncharacterized protein NEOC65_002411 [Neochlamydia sp. AcF65]|nr:Uncharacterized protein [Neochlamydia sp. AcF65]MBS4169717.1 Uncharacterized protein [Neochlamydia sp. AcF95]